MKNKTYIIVIISALLCGMAGSCDKDPEFDKGQYLYEDQELHYLNGMVIRWSDKNLPDSIKQAVREIFSNMVYVQGGTFTMGSDGLVFSNESPDHQVALSDYYIARVTITQKQWRTIIGSHDLWSYNYGKGDNYPANFISYEQALNFIERLNDYSGLQFRLPTEAEWEYAALGGNALSGYVYSGSSNVDEVAWHNGNAGGKAHPVATLKPNELGLYDMSGNVWEWCSDYYGDYTPEMVVNPTGPVQGTKRVLRGGSFTYESDYARIKTRSGLPETNQSLAVGLRLAMTPVN